MRKVEWDSFRFQFITHENDRMTYLDGARAALAGGCRWIQLRMKNAKRKEVVELGKVLKKECVEKGAYLIIDDMVEVCYALKADGVHLGKDDMKLEDARDLLGVDAIIGATCHDVEDLKNAEYNWADYAGVGPFRFTSTKEKLNPDLLGLEGYERICKESIWAGVTLPKVAIGGIRDEDVRPIMATGMDGVAISGEIINASDPVKKTHEIIERLKDLKYSK